METYNYREAVKADILDYLKENDFNAKDYSDKDDAYNYLYDLLWLHDSVTGNGSGSYTIYTSIAEENLCHNWGLLAEALEVFGYEGVNIVEKGANWCDVTIRCYLLDECLSDVLDEYEWND